MTGLHNKNPDYFYDRGNLFNTWLDGTHPRPSQPSSFTRRRIAAESANAKRAVGAPTALQAKSLRRTAAPENASRAAEKTPRPTSGYGNGSQTAAVAGARLAGFATQHMTLRETAQLLRLIAERERIRIPAPSETDRRLPLMLGRFVAAHVAPGLAAKYLEILQARLERGEPFSPK
jgi:hypothetical protein